MQKTAKPGERGILNRLREMTNVSGIAAEKFFNPQFKAVMEEIREKDDQIRSIVTGSRIGKAEPGPDAKALKDLLKQAKSNLNRREYLTAVSDLSIFHRKIKEIIDAINSIKSKVDEVHHDFLFKDLKPEHLDELQDLRKRLAARHRVEMIKEAGVIDFLKNIGTARGRALAAWEKRYPNEVKKIRDGASNVLAKSQYLLETIISSLKEMAQARSVRDPDAYMKASAQIEKAFNPYENGKGGFKEYYNTVLKEWFEKLDKMQKVNAPSGAVPSGAAPTAGELGNQEISTEKKPSVTLEMPPLPQAAPGAATAPPAAETGGTVTVERKPTVTLDMPPLPQAPGQLALPLGQVGSPPHAPPAAEEAAPDTTPEGKPKSELGAVSHQKFYKSLEKLSGESPSILASYIAKYAKAIQLDDPETSLYLFKIVKNIRG